MPTPPDPSSSAPPGGPSSPTEIKRTEPASAGAPLARPPAPTEHWQTPLTGHGLAYFRELVVDYATLQWINPFAAAWAVADKEAGEKEKAAAAAEEAFKKATVGSPPKPPSATADPAQTALDDAKKKAADAREKAVELLEKKDMAQKAKDAACNLIEALIVKSKQDPPKDQPTWSDLLEFESALLRVLPQEKLLAKYESLKAEYKGLTGADAPAGPPENPKATPEEKENALRANAETLLADLHWAYTTGPVQEAQKSKLVFTLACFTLLVFLAALIFGYWCSVLAGVAFAGAAGAALSAFQRVQSRNVKGDALTNCEKVHDTRRWFTGAFLGKLWSQVSLRLSFAVAPMIGALSAVVLAHILAADLISGPLLPKFPEAPTNAPPAVGSTNAFPSTNAPSNTNQLAATNQLTVEVSSNTPLPGGARPAVALTNGSSSNGPNARAGGTNDSKAKQNRIARVCNCWRFTTCKNLALLLVWGFIAGFSERLVPDIVSRLADRVNQQNK